jgi:hypothetical protein
MKFEPEFKTAISNLSSSEKDKLIFRLLKKDLLLANQLLFELIDTDTIDDKRKKMQKNIIRQVEQMTNRFYSSGYLMMDLRYLSGEITQHIKVTKDKTGEAALNLLMLNEVLKKNNPAINNERANKSEKLNIYIVARVFKILLLIQKMDEDYFIEYKENLIKLGKLIGANHHLMNIAIHHGLDVNWLINAEIPNNLVEIHKKIKENGYLK